MILLELSSIGHIWVVPSVKIARKGEGRRGKANWRKEEKILPFPSTFQNILCSYYLKHFWTHRSARAPTPIFALFGCAMVRICDTKKGAWDLARSSAGVRDFVFFLAELCNRTGRLKGLLWRRS